MYDRLPRDMEATLPRYEARCSIRVTSTHSCIADHINRKLALVRGARGGGLQSLRLRDSLTFVLLEGRLLTASSCSFTVPCRISHSPSTIIWWIHFHCDNSCTFTRGHRSPALLSTATRPCAQH